MKTTIRIINRLNGFMMWIAGILMLVMGLLLAYAVFMRQFFNSPPAWSFDLTEWFTGLAAFLGGGYALLHDAHVRVDIFYEKFPKKVQNWVDVATTVFILLLVTVFVWYGMEQVIDNYKAGTIETTGLDIHVWIKWLMMPIGGLLLGIQAIANLIDDIYSIITGEHLKEEVES